MFLLLLIRHLLHERIGFGALLGSQGVGGPDAVLQRAALILRLLDHLLERLEPRGQAVCLRRHPPLLVRHRRVDGLLGPLVPILLPLRQVLRIGCERRHGPFDRRPSEHFPALLQPLLELLRGLGKLLHHIPCLLRVEPLQRLASLGELLPEFRRQGLIDHRGQVVRCPLPSAARARHAYLPGGWPDGDLHVEGGQSR